MTEPADSLTFKIPDYIELSATGQTAIFAVVLILAAYGFGKRFRWW